MRTLPQWLSIRTSVCHAPVYPNPNGYDALCMLCDLPTHHHPEERNPGTDSSLQWYRLPRGQRDGWSDLLEIMGE